MIAFTKDQALARDLRDGSVLDRLVSGASNSNEKYNSLLKEVEIIEAAVRNASRPGCVEFKPSRNTFNDVRVMSDSNSLADFADENFQKFPKRILGRIALEMESEQPDSELIRTLTELYKVLV